MPLGTAHLPPDRIGAAQARRRRGASAPSAFVEEAQRWLDDDAVAEPTPAAAEPRRRRRARARILLADDNADMRDYVRRLLGDRWDVEAVARRRAGARRGRARAAPDLVLTDVMMPELDGFGLLRALRADEAHARTSR